MDSYGYQINQYHFKGIFLQFPVTVYSDVHRVYWLLACSHMAYNSSSGRWTAGVDCGLPALCRWHVEVGPRKLSLNFRPHWRNLVQFFFEPEQSTQGAAPQLWVGFLQTPIYHHLSVDKPWFLPNSSCGNPGPVAVGQIQQLPGRAERFGTCWVFGPKWCWAPVVWTMGNHPTWGDGEIMGIEWNSWLWVSRVNTHAYIYIYRYYYIYICIIYVLFQYKEWSSMKMCVFVGLTGPTRCDKIQGS